MGLTGPSCFSPTLTDGHIRCGETGGGCPAGFRCATNGLCYRNPLGDTRVDVVAERIAVREAAVRSDGVADRTAAKIDAPVADSLHVCLPVTATCSAAAECCSKQCSGRVCVCSVVGGFCADTSDCCSNEQCNGGTCCGTPGASCTGNVDCCSHSCVVGACV